MVFVKDFRKEFYDVVHSDRVLVLVGHGVDALSACRILQYLFQCDQVLYTIVPVTGRQALEEAYNENCEGIRYVVMINCGATIDVVEVLQPEDHVVFFICDSHRPVDVHNIFNQVQVRLLMREDEFDDVPEYEQIFRDESDSEDDSGNDSDDSSAPSGKRRRFDEAALERRRDRRLWAEKRQKIIFDYMEFSSFGTSAALLIYELAWRMSKDTNDLLWLAILGVSDQYFHRQVDRDKYIEDVGHLQGHVSRHNHRPDDSENAISVDCLKIAFDQELKLTLYRHWSLFESICHSIQMACKFKIWTLKGRKRLQEFLADMGLPLVQCKQKFSAMDIHLRESIKEMLTQQADKYSFQEQDLFLPSFHAQYGYRNKFCATDVMLACESLLESPDKEKQASDNFLQALDILKRTNVADMDKGIELAKLQLKAICNQVQSFLDMGQVISAGPFLYAFAQEGTPDVRFFSKPICLQKLAQFTLDAYRSVTKSKKVNSLPLVLGAPLDSDTGTMLVVGIPPASANTARNFFGKAFEQAANSTGSRNRQDNFDSHIIEIKTEDKSKFFDALVSLLQ